MLAGLILPTIHAELFLQLRLSFADPLRMLPCLLLRLILEPVGLAHYRLRYRLRYPDRGGEPRLIP